MNHYYMVLKKLLDDNDRTYYNHEFMLILFSSQKFLDTLSTLEIVDKKYGYYGIDRDFYWNGEFFIKCYQQNNFCEDEVKRKLNTIYNKDVDDL